MSLKARSLRKFPKALAASIATLTASLLLGSMQHGFAADGTWLANPVDANWEPPVGPNWNTGGGTFPGATSGTSNTDVATFSSGSSQTAITINNSLNVGGITFTGAAASYTVGTTAGLPIVLTSGGTIQIDSSLTSTSVTETINAPLQIGGSGGTYTIQNNSADSGAGSGTLVIGGAVSGGTAGGTDTLTLSGSNKGASLVNGIISDGAATALNLVKDGSGYWSLNKANTFTGTTLIKDGSLFVQGGSDSVLGTGQVTVGDGVGAAGSAVLWIQGDGSLADTQNIVINSDGLLKLPGHFDTVGAISSSSATAEISVETSTLTTTVNADTTFAGVISGFGGLNKGGTGTWTLSGMNTFNDELYVMQGTIKAGSTQAFGIGANVGVDGTLDLNGFSETIGGLLNGFQVTTGIVDNTGTAAATLTFGNNTDQTYDGHIQNTGGALSLVKNGTSTETFTATNTYSGGTTINNGIILITASNGLGTGALTLNAQDGTTHGTLNISGAAVTQTVTGLTIYASPTGGKAVTGTGTLILNGDFNLLDNTTAGGTAATTTVIDVATIDLGASTRTFNIAGQNNGTSDLTISSAIVGGGGITIDAAPSSSTQAPGLVVFTGNAVNVYSGTTTVNDGKLFLNGTAGTQKIAGNLIIGDGLGNVNGLNNTAQVVLGAANQIKDTSDVTIKADGRFDMGGFAETIHSLTVVSGNVVNMSNTAGQNLTLTGALNMTGGSISGGTGASEGVLLSGAAGVSDVTAASDANGNAATISSNLDLGGLTRTFTVNKGTGSVDLEITGVVQNGTGLVKEGSGVMRLSSASGNTFTGNTLVNDGTLALNATSGNDAVPGDTTIGNNVGAASTAVLRLDGDSQISDAANVTINTDGQFNMNGHGETITNLVINSGSVTNVRADGTGSLGLLGNLTMTGGSITGGTGSGVAGLIFADNTGASGVTATSNAAGQAAFIGSNISLHGFNRTFTVNAGGGPVDLIVSGVIQDATGGIIKNGLGTMVLAGANTYTGATVVNAGRLEIAAGGSISQASAITLNANTFLDLNLKNGGIFANNILNNGTVTGMNAAGTTQTLTGVISGTGGFSQTGAGKTIFKSAQTYTGNTSVSAGILQVDGSIVSPETFVTGTGSLQGRGFIFGNVRNTGNVAPGDSPGTLTIKGNYNQGNNGTLTIEFAGTGADQHDLLAVQGHAAIDGTLRLTKVGKGPKLKVGESVAFLTATGGVSGQFAKVDNAFSTDTIVGADVIYTGNSVDLLGIRNSFVLSGLTPNQKAVARDLDVAAGGRRARQLFAFLDNEALAKLPADYGRIAPEELTSVFTLGVSLASVQSGNIQRRTDDLRSGSSGFNAAGLALNGAGPSYSGSFGSGVAGPTGRDDKASPPVAALPADSKLGVFLSGTGEWVSVGDTDNARGYDLTSGGFTLGVDYKVTPNFAVGLAAGYTGSSADLTDRGRVYVNGGKLGLYATFFQNEQVTPAPTMSKDAKDVKEVQPPVYTVAKGFYADLAVFGGYNSYDFRRSGLQGETRGDTDGGELNVLFGTGYDFKRGNLTFGPTATFNYTYIGTSDFTEHGSLAPLDVHGGKGESLRTSIGFKASYDWKVGSVLIRPEIRASWQHEFGDTAYAFDSNLATGAGDSFRVNGPQLGRDSALLGAGFAVQFNERLSTYLYYDGELGRKEYQSTNVTGGLRVAF